jgi:hypothetical protein
VKNMPQSPELADFTLPLAAPTWLTIRKFPLNDIELRAFSYCTKPSLRLPVAR